MACTPTLSRARGFDWSSPSSQYCICLPSALSQYGLHGFAMPEQKTCPDTLCCCTKEEKGLFCRVWKGECHRTALRKYCSKSREIPAINTIAITAFWCWKPETHTCACGWTDMDILSKKSILSHVTWIIPDGQSERPTKRRNKQVTDVKNADLNILESHSFTADFNYFGNTVFDGNILCVGSSLNTAWTGCTTRAEVTTNRSSGQ